ncbi:VOC family protein [Pseudonocardia benzenivorans]
MTVRFKDLCADAADPARVAAFWAELGMRAAPRADGVVALLRDETPWLWVNPVPEPKVGKNRVHLDLVVPGREVLVRRGSPSSTSSASSPIPRATSSAPRSRPGAASDNPAALALCVDSADPVAAAAWWAARTGARTVLGPDGTPRYLEDVPGLDMTWKFVLSTTRAPPRTAGTGT